MKHCSWPLASSITTTLDLRLIAEGMQVLDVGYGGSLELSLGERAGVVAVKVAGMDLVLLSVAGVGHVQPLGRERARAENDSGGIAGSNRGQASAHL